nr:hypothetical protein KPHV_27000 [Kitasatospora purpeofusca]
MTGSSRWRALAFAPGFARVGLRRCGGRIPLEGARSVEDPRVHLLGCGDRTGSAATTLIGVGRTARTAVEQIRSLTT